MTRQLTAGILGVVLIAAAACGKSAEQKQAEETAKTITEATQAGANQMAAGAAAMAKGLEQMSKGSANVEVLPFETLGASFPEVSGWTREEITGSTTNFPMKMSEAKTNYRDGDKRLRLEAVDATLAQMMFAPFSMYLAANYSERSSDGYKKGTSIKGEPAFEEVNTKSETAEVTVVVGKRFIVTAHGNRGTSIENVRAVLEQMDFSKLTAAK
ncbi:MAG: hypothetical protein ABIP90_07635 [Vicinamibacterales bacterium]